MDQQIPHLRFEASSFLSVFFWSHASLGLFQSCPVWSWMVLAELTCTITSGQNFHPRKSMLSPHPSNPWADAGPACSYWGGGSWGSGGGGRKRGWLNMEGQVRDCSRGWTPSTGFPWQRPPQRQADVTLGPGLGNTGGSGFTGATPPSPATAATRTLSSLPCPNFPLIHVQGLCGSLSIATLNHRSRPLYHADLMTMKAYPEGRDYHEGNEQASATRTPDREDWLQKVTARNITLLLS